MKNLFITVLLLFLCSQLPPLWLASSPTSRSGGEARSQSERLSSDSFFLNYYDLVELSQTASPKGELLEKLDSQLNTPIIEQPLNQERPDNFLRIANWNIERGFNTELIEKIFERSFLTNNLNLIDELDIFSKASIIVLNETDIGIPRTKYENIPKRLAHFLKAGHVFCQPATDWRWHHRAYAIRSLLCTDSVTTVLVCFVVVASLPFITLVNCNTLASSLYSFYR